MDTLQNITCEKRTYTRLYHSHKHEFSQFLFPLEGHIDLETEEQRVKLTPEHFLYIPPECEHRFRSIGRNECLVLDIPLHVMNIEHHDMASGLEAKVDPFWSSIRYLLKEEANSKSSHTLHLLVQYITEKIQTYSHSSIAYIHSHLSETLSIKKLAELEHYHPAYYSSWFKNRTGKTPQKYIADLRLAEAKRMLAEKNEPLTAVSQKLGFQNPSSFTRWFAKSAGMAPRDYRNTFHSDKMF
ncbi:AraC family transcriptional regulator [Bacillus atrophaeus]|uniref:AraC family transcriptional regulator n=1 Tax=Bacillus atrophaeus TaxID=1452 RepID=UPI001EFC10A1|nr:AraC family transcriptional regulator [Bacillus atrophaeus]MCG8397194.1 AraC family transcriptional regulator [Bacillus atrophaeus]